MSWENKLKEKVAELESAGYTKHNLSCYNELAGMPVPSVEQMAEDMCKHIDAVLNDTVPASQVDIFPRWVDAETYEH